MNASLVAVIWWYIWHSAQRLKVSTIHTLKLPELWKIFWGIVMLFMFIVYTVSTLVLVSNYRFFVVFVYCGIIALVFTLGSKLNKLARAILVLLLLGGTCFNLSITTMSGYVKGQPNVSSNMGNALNYTLIRAVDNLHVHKGYTTYWQGNINTYLSKEQHSICRLFVRAASYVHLNGSSTEVNLASLQRKVFTYMTLLTAPLQTVLQRR